MTWCREREEEEGRKGKEEVDRDRQVDAQTDRYKEDRRGKEREETYERGERGEKGEGRESRIREKEEREPEKGEKRYIGKREAGTVLIDIFC